MSLDFWIRLAFSVGVASTYGYGERSCGDVGHPRRCATGASTASGVEFDTRVPQLAVAAPDYIPIPPRIIWVTAGVPEVPGGGPKCVAVWLVDKMNPRWIGVRGFDVNPEALRRLVGPEAATPEWSGRLTACGESKKLNHYPRTGVPIGQFK